MYKAQTPADVMCDFNDTFETEENSTNLWQQSTEGEHKDKDEFGEEANEMFNDKNRCEQHAKQCILEKGLKTFGTQGEATFWQNKS